MTYLLLSLGCAFLGFCYGEARGFGRGVRLMAGWKPRESKLKHEVMMSKCDCGGVKPAETPSPSTL